MKTIVGTLVVIGLSLSGMLSLTKEHSPNPILSHAFEEPLVPIGATSNMDNQSLVAVLKIYQQRKSYEDVSAITGYLNSHPESPWKFSLLANLGNIYRKAGYFSRALDVWQKAWDLGKGQDDVKVQALSNKVVTDLAALLSSLGRSERLEPLLKELKGRKFFGSSGSRLISARESLWLMKNRPQDGLTPKSWTG